MSALKDIVLGFRSSGGGPPPRPVGLAVVGCGFVADFYMATLAAHPGLRVVGAHDRDAGRLAAFAAHHHVPAYGAFEAVLADPRVEMVLNLTNPRSHFAVTRRCLEAGKHVYSEKPLAMTAGEAAELVALAARRGVRLAMAPCSLLGESAQTLWKALNDGMIGRVRLVYANFEDGMVHRAEPSRWVSASGAPWPARDEFEVGTTFEHAGYNLSWLAAFFGPALRVRAYARCLLPDKGVEVEAMAPDFSVGLVEYGGGVVARVTCGLLAPRDKSLTVVGDEGVLTVRNVRDDAAPVTLRRTPPNRVLAGLGRRWALAWERAEAMLRLPVSVGGWRVERRLAFARPPGFRSSSGGKRVDFMRGPAELADAIREGRPCRLSAELALHITEVTEALQHPQRFGGDKRIQSRFAPLVPLA